MAGSISTGPAEPKAGVEAGHLGLGVAFPEVGGRRSTTTTGREILADAAAAADPALAERIRASRRWRQDYIDAIRELTVRSIDGEAAVAIARAGLASMRRRLVFERGESAVSIERSLAAVEPEFEFETRVIRGNARPVTSLRVPYAGGQLEGRALTEQLEAWVAAGAIERSFADAVQSVAANPQWLSLPGRMVALVGAGAEIGPLEPLCAWGADVTVLDVPDVALWEGIARVAAAGAGTLRAPVGPSGAVGADVLRMLPEIRPWLYRTAQDGRLVLGMYAYADGGAHVCLSAAFDALASDALAHRVDTALSFLATPTDAFVVPQDAMERSRAAYAGRRARRLLQAPAQLLSSRRLFAPAYSGGLPVADALVKQQGPNYAIAKRLQRWRGVSAIAGGDEVSFNVAPASWTRSVTKNRILAAAYSGARHFGIEVFPAETTRVLMAALLVHDLNRPARADDAPESLFSSQAAHGGLWSAAYEPRSALGVAALAGLPGTLLPGRRARRP